MTEKEQPPVKQRPVVAIGITAVVCALATQDQLSSGSVDTPMLGALIVLTAFWMGRGIDGPLRKWLGL